tara:strand:+ start:1119 stop:1580 length:462 start_codon:yes stop_codon:yes gene_type:complete
MRTGWLTLLTQLVRGHQVASGIAEEERFPNGTLAMQLPHFEQRGLDLTSFYKGTLNLSIAPKQFRILETTHCFEDVKWASNEPAENFWFLDCRVGLNLEDFVDGYIYYPDPETKPCHFQPPNVLEVIAPELPDVNYGDSIWLAIRRNQIEITD